MSVFIKVKYCPRCGKAPLDDRTVICSYCGAVLTVKYIIPKKPKIKENYGLDSYVVCPKCFKRVSSIFLTFGFDSDGNTVKYLRCPKCGVLSRVKVKQHSGRKKVLETY